MFVNEKTTVESFRDRLIDIVRSVLSAVLISIGPMMNNNDVDSDDNGWWAWQCLVVLTISN